MSCVSCLWADTLWVEVFILKQTSGGGLPLQFYLLCLPPPFVTVSLPSFCGFVCSKTAYTFPETHQSLWVKPTRDFVFFLFFFGLSFPSFLPFLPWRLLTGMKHKTVGRCGYSCEAGVPLVLADEILVRPKQQQGHCFSFTQQSLFLIILLSHVFTVWEEPNGSG